MIASLYTYLAFLSLLTIYSLRVRVLWFFFSLLSFPNTLQIVVIKIVLIVLSLSLSTIYLSLQQVGCLKMSKLQLQATFKQKRRQKKNLKRYDMPFSSLSDPLPLVLLCINGVPCKTDSEVMKKKSHCGYKYKKKTNNYYIDKYIASSFFFLSK